MMNCVLFCVLLAGIGACYVWLGSKKKDRAEQIVRLHREIDETRSRLREVEMRISHRLTPEALWAGAARFAGDLAPIDIKRKGSLIRMPDPPAGDGTSLPSPKLPQEPVLAGNRRP